MFSKVLGAVLPGYFVWLLVSTGLFEFTTTFCVVIVLMGIVLNIGIFGVGSERENPCSGSRVKMEN